MNMDAKWKRENNDELSFKISPWIAEKNSWCAVNEDVGLRFGGLGGGFNPKLAEKPALLIVVETKLSNYNFLGMEKL